MSHRYWRHRLSEPVAILRVAAPLAVAQLVMCVTGLADSVMAGQFSVEALTAVAMGSAIWIPFNVFLVGLFSPLTSLFSELVGRGRADGLDATCRQGIGCALLSGVPALAALLFCEHYMPLLALAPNTESITVGYLHAIAPAMPLVAVNQVLRGYFQSQGKALRDMMIQLLGLLLNIPLNYGLIYGCWGLPRLGAVGAGYATLAVFALVASLSMLCAIRDGLRLRGEGNARVISSARIVTTGLPYALLLFFQFVAFTLIAAMLSRLGEQTVSAHQIAYNISNLPLALSSSLATAAMIRVSFFIGKEQHHQARSAGMVGIILTVGSASLAGLTIVLFSRQIAGCYTENLAIVLAAVALMKMVPAYHISKSVQITVTALLRSYQDTVKPMVVGLTSLWGLAIPLGFALAFWPVMQHSLGAKGFWYSLTLANIIASVLLTARYLKIRFATEGLSHEE